MSAPVAATDVARAAAAAESPAGPLAPAGPAVLLPPSPLLRPSAWQAATLSPLALAALDGAAIVASFFIAYYLRFHVRIPPPAEVHALRAYAGTIPLGTAAILIAFIGLSLYRRQYLISLVEQSFRVVIGVVVGLTATLALSAWLLRGYAEFSRLFLIYQAIFCIGLTCGGRLLWVIWRDRLARQGIAVRRIVILGAGAAGERVAVHFAAEPGLGYRVLGFLDDVVARGTVVATGQRVLGSVAELPALLADTRPDEVIVAAPGLTNERLLQLIQQCEQFRAGVRVFPDLLQIRVSDANLVNLRGLPLIDVKAAELQDWQRQVKRWFDFLVSAAALVALAPVLLVICVLVKLESPGPALYAQERVGQDAKRFHIIKFRSMLDQAEERTGRYWTVREDDRRTRVGRWLRRYSIDELPNLINVLVGDMSLVGPRPERPMFVAEFSATVPDYLKRLREKSGMTGWAQVNGLRGDVSIEERTKYDLYYIENWTLLLDIKIICRSILRLFHDRSAY